MEPTKYIIPQNSFKDALAILVVLLAFPTPLAFLVLSLFILTSSSRKFASKLFTRLSGSSLSQQSVSIPSSFTSTASKDQVENHIFTPLLLIGLLDIFLCVLLRFALPKFTRYVFILAEAIVATTLSGNNIWNSVFATLVIGFLDYSFRQTLDYLESSFGIVISGTQDLFPQLPKINTSLNYVFSYFSSVFKLSKQSSIQPYYYYNPIEQNYFYSIGIFALNYLNLILSIHIVLMVFASFSRKNFISRSINQLSSLDQELHYSPFSTFLLNKEKEERNIKLIEIELSDEISKSVLILEDDDQINREEAPASYPSSSNSSDYLSASTIVAENFEVFCKTSFTKPKNSIKSIQPLWSLIATMKSMSVKKDIYSGSVQINDGDNNSLVLSDSASKYDENELQNYEDGFRREKVLIFIDYIGETLISFQLKNFNYSSDEIVVRVNGIIWYQVSSGIHENEKYLIVGGLTPLSQYDIQFLTEEEDANGRKRKILIDDLIVSTVNSNGEDISTTNTNSGKLSSPLTTLRGSLITTNENLNKERAKLKKTKKEITKKLNSYRQDIEVLKSKISNSDKNDEKNWKKVLSLRSSVKQVEEDVSKIELEITEVEAKENEILEIHAVEKRKFDLIARNYQNFKNAFNGKLSERRETLTELSNEIETLHLKKEKISAKYDKITAEVNKLSKEISDIYSGEIQDRLVQRKKRADKRMAMLNEFKDEIEKQQNSVLRLSQENEKLKNSILQQATESMQ